MQRCRGYASIPNVTQSIVDGSDAPLLPSRLKDLLYVSFAQSLAPNASSRYQRGRGGQAMHSRLSLRGPLPRRGLARLRSSSEIVLSDFISSPGRDRSDDTSDTPSHPRLTGLRGISRRRIDQLLTVYFTHVHVSAKTCPVLMAECLALALQTNVRGRKGSRTTVTCHAVHCRLCVRLE